MRNPSLWVGEKASLIARAAEVSAAMTPRDTSGMGSFRSGFLVLALVYGLPSAWTLLPAQTFAAAEGDASPLIQEGLKLQQNGEYLAAFAKFDSALQRNPKDATAYALRASAYSFLGSNDNAIADVAKALELGADKKATYSLRGMIYMRAYKDDQAIADFSRALDLGDRRRESIFVNRGLAYARNGRNQEALDDANEAIKLNPGNTRSYLVRGWALVSLEKYKEGLDDLSKYLIASPSDPVANALQGFAFFKLNMSEEAKVNVRKAIENEPRLAPAFSGDGTLNFYDRDKRRSMVKQFLKTAREAETAGNWQAAFDSYLATTAWGMGYTADDRKETEEAREGLLHAYPRLKTKPAVPEEARRYLVRAQASVRDRRYDKSIESLETVVRTTPWLPDAYFNLALIFAEHNVYDVAIKDMKTYLKLLPNASDARAAQDKIYEWEAKVRK